MHKNTKFPHHPAKKYSCLLLIAALVLSQVHALPAVSAATSSWKPAQLVNSESFQIIDEADGNTDIEIRWGQTLNEKLIYDRTNNRFKFSRQLFVGGNLTATGALSIKRNMSGSSLRVDNNADIWGALSTTGAILTKSSVTVNSDSDSNDATITFGNQSANQTLKFNHANQRFDFSKGINVRGTMSGAALTVMAGDSYVLGNVGLGKSVSPNAKLEIIGTASGRIVRAQDTLASSGTLSVAGAARFGSTIRANTITYTFPPSDGSASGKVLATDSAGQLSWTNKDLTMKAKTADYTAAVGDLVLADASITAGFQVTLPNTTATGARVGVKLTNTSGTRTVRVAGSQTTLNIQDRETATGSILLYVKGDYIELKHDGTRWNIVSEGRIPHKVRLTRDAAQSISQDTDTKIAIDAELYDVGQIGDFSTNDRIDIRRPGKYLVNATGGVEMDTDKVFYLEVFVNGTLQRIATITTGTTITINEDITVTLSVNTGDYVELYFYHTNTSSRNTDTSSFGRPALELIELFP